MTIQVGKGSGKMSRHSLLTNVSALLIGVFVFCVYCDGHAQILTGYDDLEDSVSPRFLNQSEFSAPVVEPVYEPSLVVHDAIDVAVSETPQSLEVSDISNSYSNFLTSPIQSVEGGSNVRSEKQPVDLEADQVAYDDSGKIVSASGNVIIVQDGRILRADNAQYNVDADIVKADGNVVLNEVNGDVHLAQEVEYSNSLSTGSVCELNTTLNDGSRFTAEKGRREGGVRTIMDAASYTACGPYDEKPDRSLPWQIRASEVTHDQDQGRVSYRNARFNVYGVPVAYTPYFSHPDGSVERKNGFLSPSFGFKSELGAFLENQYYIDIAPDKDATIGLLVMTEQAPLGLVEYRQRWRDAAISINGGVTYSDRTDTEEVKDIVRGHVFANGLWDINDKWRSGVDIAYVSDDQYARQYDISDEDVLQNRLYVERFSGRSYAQGAVQLYQDIRVSDLEVDQPGVLPEANISFIGEPGAVPIVKGRWDAEFGVLSLFRDGDDQDVIRASSDLGWERRLVSDYGLVTDIEASLRGDVFFVSDRDITSTDGSQDQDIIESRFYPQFNIQSSYPVARNFERSQLIVEPIASLTVSTKNEGSDDIPNEDSQDVQLDASNLFEPNRFPGLDAVEDQSRVTYGVRAGLNGYDGSDLEVFVGQSYRFDNDDNPFQDGSGLAEQRSDLVGYIKGDYDDRYIAQYRFQLDQENLASERHELDLEADWNRFRLNASYLYAAALEGTEITENREQLSSSAEYYLNKKWSMQLGSQYDLGEDPGLRTASLGLNYFGQCVSWSLQGVRNLTNDSSGDSDTEIVLRIGLKNISEFATSGLRDEGKSP